MDFSSRSESFPGHLTGLGVVSATLARCFDSPSVSDAPAMIDLVNLAIRDDSHRCIDLRLLAHLRSNIASRRSYDREIPSWTSGTLRRLPVSSYGCFLVLPRGNPRPQHVGLPHPPNRRAPKRRCDSDLTFRPCFMSVRPWASSLQRFLYVLAAGPSRVEQSSLPLSALRWTDFEDFSIGNHAWSTFRPSSHGFPDVSVHAGLRYSRRSAVAPLLVVPPLRGFSDVPTCLRGRFTFSLAPGFLRPPWPPMSGLASCFHKAPLLGFNRIIKLRRPRVLRPVLA